jgi:hypothetical protein
MASATATFQSNARAVLRPLGCYVRESNGQARFSDRITSLLALHRVVSEAAFADPLWSRAGAALCRALLVRVRSSDSRSRRG